MTSSKSYTNSDIVQLITVQHEETSSRLGAIEEQVKYTNGQVRVLNSFKERIEAVDEYKKNLPTVQVNNTTKDVDWAKIVLAILGVLGTALAIIGTLAARNTT